MIRNFEEVRKQLSELAGVINAFKSEAVQLRLVELVFGSVAKGEKESSGDSKKGTRHRQRPSRKKSGTDNPAGGTGSKAKATGRPGGWGMLAKLMDEGFFKKPKTIRQLVEHCDHNLALKYQQSDFSGALARYVRDGKLKRTKNADKQYEYSQA